MDCGGCKFEDKIIELVEHTAANTENVKHLTTSINTMQKWIMGFVISVLLLVIGVGVGNYISPTRAIAKEIIAKEKFNVVNNNGGRG